MTDKHTDLIVDPKFGANEIHKSNILQERVGNISSGSNKKIDIGPTEIFTMGVTYE